MESKCNKVERTVDDLIDWDRSPMRSTEMSCKAAVTIIDKVVIEDGKRLLGPGIDPRLFRREIQSLWSATYFIPHIQSTVEKLRNKEISATSAEQKLAPFIPELWSTVDREVLKKIFHELAVLTVSRDIDPSMRVSLARLAAMLALPLLNRLEIQNDTTETAYQSLLASTDPKLQVAGIALLEATLNRHPGLEFRPSHWNGGGYWKHPLPQHVTLYHKRALRSLAILLNRSDLQPQVFANAVQLLGQAGQLLPTKTSEFPSREIVAAFLFDLAESKKRSVPQKGLVVLALEVLDHRDRFLWSPKLVRRLLDLEIPETASMRENATFYNTILLYIKSRLQSVITEHSEEVFFASGQFISVEASDLFRLLGEGSISAQQRISALDLLASILFDQTVDPVVRMHLLAAGTKMSEDKTYPNIAPIMIAGATLAMINIADRKSDSVTEQLFWMDSFILQRLPVEKDDIHSVVSALNLVGRILQKRDHGDRVPPDAAKIIGQWLEKKGLLEPLLAKLDDKLPGISSKTQGFIAQGLKAILHDMPNGQLNAHIGDILKKLELQLGRVVNSAAP